MEVTVALVCAASPLILLLKIVPWSDVLLPFEFICTEFDTETVIVGIAASQAVLSTYMIIWTS